MRHAPQDAFPHNGSEWEVIRCWQSIGDDYVTVEYVEIYRPERGSVLVRLSDRAELSVPVKRPAELRPVR